MDPTRIILPWRGIGDVTSWVDQPGEICPADSMRNVLLFTPDHDRPTMGTRWGTSKLFPDQFGNGKPLQAFCVVERAAGVTGLQAGPLTTPEASSRVAVPFSGHCFTIDSVGSMYIALADGRAIGGLAGGVAWHPTDRKVAFFTFYDTDGAGALPARTGINFYDVENLAQVWQAEAGDAFTGAVFGNNIVVGTRYTFVSAGIWVWVFKTEDGSFCKKYDCSGWSNEVMQVALDPAGEYLYALFIGSGNAATRSLPNQPSLVPDIDLRFFTSGVMKFRVTSADAEPLEQVQFGTPLATTDPWFEAAHGYLRFSEVLERAPRGCLPYCMAVGPSGEVAVGFTNKGWGWTSTYAADDASTSYRNVALFTSSGVKVWEVDANSRRVPYTGTHGTYLNDIPQIDDDDDFRYTGPEDVSTRTLTPKPSANALAIDNFGDVYVGGQRTSISGGLYKGVRKLRGDSGAIVWEYDPGSVIEQHAMAIDPGDGHLWVGIMRNSTYASAGGANAILLKVNSVDGTTLFKYDITPAPANGVWGVAVRAGGEVAFATDYVS